MTSTIEVKFPNMGDEFSDMEDEVPDIDDLVECIANSLSVTSEDHPRFPLVLGARAAFHAQRFNLSGELDDINKAIEYMSTAISLTPDDDSRMPFFLYVQGSYYSQRFQRGGQEDDIGKAVEYASLALAITPEDDPEISNILALQGVCYTSRFQRLGELDDLENGIDYGSRAVKAAPDDHPELAAQLDQLGASYGYRFKRLGDLNDLDKAINYCSRALELTDEGDPALLGRLANAGVAYGARFERLGELADLGQAIEYQKYAFVLTPNHHPRMPNRIVALGASYKLLFQRSKDIGDLELAMESESLAVQLTPSGHPLLPTVLANLAGSHGTRFQLMKEPDDLEKAIECATRSVALTQDGDPHLSTRLANLGTFYSLQFERSGKLRDLEKAFDYQSRALSLTPDGHPSLALQYKTLAVLRFTIYRLMGDPTHLQHSLDAFRKACQTRAGAPRERFGYAHLWAKVASEYGELNCIEAYQTTISLLPQFVWLGATTNQRYEDLLTAESLAVAAASAAIHSSNYLLALEWLEHARCVVWNQSLMLRSPLGDLHSFQPELASRLESIANQLHRATTEARESQMLTSGSLDREQVAQQHHRLAEEYEDLLSQTRSLPGFENFLQPMKASELVRAARNGPIVVINCHDRCDALVVLPGKDNVDHVPLPNFTPEKARNARFEMYKSLRNKGIRERGIKVLPIPGEKDKFATVLAVLWTDVVKPVLDFLGCTSDIPTEKLPHITWCPTGSLSFLPLHAAGDYDKPRSRVFDYVISSYTPTLTALLASTPSSLSSTSQVLAVGMAVTPGHFSPLPGTAAELACAKGHFGNVTGYSQLVNDQATTTAVLDAMEQYDWVHLACHAHQNVEDPTKSGFFLHDGTLDLAAINRRSFKNKGLAFLSACQTATGDERLPDEAIHLASGMLMAGYTSVIGTMWSVIDQDAPFVADKVYGQLVETRKVGNGEAGEALHNAVAELRERVGEKEFGRWVPYIHFGS